MGARGSAAADLPGHQRRGRPTRARLGGQAGDLCPAPEKLTEMLRRWRTPGGADRRIHHRSTWAPTENRRGGPSHGSMALQRLLSPANANLRLVDYEAVSADGVSRGEQLDAQ